MALPKHQLQRSALLLRKLLGPIGMEPVTPDIGRPYYRALSDLDVLAIVENDPDSPDDDRRHWTKPLSAVGASSTR